MKETCDSPPAIQPPHSWDPIICEVNAWRGACMHHFTAVEQAVTETLVALHAAKPLGTSVRLRHLIGQRFEDLAAAVGDNGPYANAGKVVAGTLSLFRERHEAFRTLLCHSQMTVAVEISGKWIVVARILAIRGSAADRRLEVIEQSDAAGRLSQLKRDGQKLAAQLGSLRKAVAAA